MSFKNDFLTLQAQTTPFAPAIEIDRAEGSYIVDREGKKYLDMVAGVAVNNIGHNHSKVVAAVQKQVERHMHVMVYGEFAQEAPANAARKLTSLLPKALNSVYFVNSGTEAIEGALKLAKRATGRSEIVSCRRSYHGSTHGSLSISGNEHKKRAFRPLLPDVRFIEHNAVPDLKAVTSRTAAIVLELIQGDGGVRTADKEYISALRKRCDDTGALLIFDEIQTGFGRTGKMFAFEHYASAPDILCLGKAMNGGMPGGAFVSSKELMSSFRSDPGLGHITTFGGHPVCCAAGVACMEVLTEEINFDEVERKGAYLQERLKHGQISDVRRKGLMLAVDLIDEDAVNTVCDECLKNGVILFRFLSHPYSFRISPPLNIEYRDLDFALEVINAALDKVK